MSGVFNYDIKPEFSILEHEVEIKQCTFCGKNHGKVKIEKNSAGDDVVKCPDTGKVVCPEYYDYYLEGK